MNKIEPGMRVTIDDGWTGKVFRVSGDMVDCTKDGPNPHCTGRLVPLAAVTIDRGGGAVKLEIEADRQSATLRRRGRSRYARSRGQTRQAS